MRVIRQTLLRGVLRALAMVISALSGIVLARKLDPSSYALYQAIVKRVEVYAALPAMIASFWAYRYSAMNIVGVARACLFVLLLNSCIVTIIGIIYSFFTPYRDAPTLLLVGLSCFLWHFFIRYRAFTIATIPVHSELAILLRRIIYAVLVFVSVYVLSMGIQGALISFTISLLIGIALLVHYTWNLLSEPTCYRCISEWFRGFYIPTLIWLSSLLIALDVVIVKTLGNDFAISAFFASTAIMTILIEIVSEAVRHLTAYIIKTRDVSSVILVARVIAFANALICCYAIARPESLIALMNPIYVVVAPALPVYAMATYIANISITLQHVIMGIDISRAHEPGRKLKLLSLINVLTSGLYILSLAIPLMFYSNVDSSRIVLIWVYANLAWRLASLIGMLTILPSTTRILYLREVIMYSLMYLAIAIPFTLFLTTPGYYPDFFRNALHIIINIGKILPLYIVTAIVIDSKIRDLIVVTLKKRTLWSKSR